jgi:hypothetical protein
MHRWMAWEYERQHRHVPWDEDAEPGLREVKMRVPKGEVRSARGSVRLLLTILVAVVAAAAASLRGASVFGFNLDNLAVTPAEIEFGGPPRDGIPAIDRPSFVSPREASFLSDNDMVVSVALNGQVRAYPLRILVWHEVVNDAIDGRIFTVSYCPLCGTAMVFDPTTEGRTLTFGVSGLLYLSNLLMFDRETESLWSQFDLTAVSGPMVGRRLNLLNSEHLTWKAWRAQHPDGLVLSLETGFDRDYAGSPYAEYERSPHPMVSTPSHRREFSPKVWVQGIVVNGRPRAYPIESLPDGVTVTDNVDGIELRVRRDRADRRVTVRDRNGQAVPSIPSYWFAWQAFYPETTVWTPSLKAEPEQDL